MITPWYAFEIVMRDGDVLGKTQNQRRIKLLEMFGENFASVTDAERLSAANGGMGNYIHPAAYAAHYPAALAGNAHPMAGQPDLPGLTYALAQEWRNRRLIGLIRDSPRRFARSVQQDILAAKSGNEAESIHRLACAHYDLKRIPWSDLIDWKAEILNIHLFPLLFQFL